MQELIDLFQERYGLIITTLSYGAAMIYFDFGMPHKKNMLKRLQNPISKVVQDVSKTTLLPTERYVALEALVADENDEEQDIPVIRVKIR